MTYKKSALIIVLLFIASLLKALSTGYETEKKTFGYSINAGIERSFWAINRKAGTSTNYIDIIDYETEGLNLYRVNGDLKIWNIPLIDFYYEHPLDTSERQKEILLINKSKGTGAEKYSLGIIFDPIAAHYFTDRGIMALILKRLCSIKLKYTKELFWGKAKAKNLFNYVPIGTNIDYENMALIDVNPVSIGDELSFRTVFSDMEISMALHEFGIPKCYIADSALRVGYFQSKWERITDAALYLKSPIHGGFVTKPILYEAKFDSKGFLISFEPVDPSAPGCNVNLSLKIGVDNSVGSAIDWRRVIGDDVDVHIIMVGAGAWYNFYFDKETSRGFALTAGGTLDYRVTVVAKSADMNDSQQEKFYDNTDIISKYFATVSYRF